MEFSRPEYWSGWPFPSPGDHPNPGIKPRSPTLQADSLPAEHQGSSRILEWVACPFSTGSSQPRNRTWSPALQVDSFQLSYQGSIADINKWQYLKKELTEWVERRRKHTLVFYLLLKMRVAYFLFSEKYSHQYHYRSAQFSRSVVSNSLWPHEPQHARPPCPSSTPRVHQNPCPWSGWCHPTISSSVMPFSSCPQSFPASGSFPMSQFFPSGGQSPVSASTSVLAMNTQNWFPLGWTGWISLPIKGLSRVLSNTTVQKHQFFCTQLSLLSNSHIHTWPWKNNSLD